VKASQLPTEPPDLLTWAEGVLPAMVTYFANHDVDLPARRRIVPGQLQLDAWDCEQVSVGFAGITDSGRNAQGATAGAPRTGSPFSAMLARQAAYGIQIVRCIPPCDGGFFTTDTDSFGEAGRQMLTESALLSQFMVDAASAPPAWHPEGVNVSTGDVTPIGPSGGYYAIEASIIFTVMARQAS
jgi:hypothetical protein